MDLVTQQKLERREHILDAARKLIAERGYAGITMRDLAARCRVSVPTLYNQFGSKDSLLAAAVETHFAGLLATSREKADWHGCERLIGVMGVCADNMVRLPRYNRSLLRAFMGARDTAPIEETIMSELACELGRALDEMAQRRQLVDWIDRPVLTQQVTAAVVATSVAWSVGALDDDGLRAAMIHAAAGMVLGVARGAARTALEAELRAAQEVLAETYADRATRAASG